MAQYRVRKQDNDKPLVELYRPKKFVAESLTSVYTSRTTVAPNGFIHTDTVKGIEDRHLKASPDLPSLRERSSKSNSKNLYDLSLQLMDPEESGGYESDWSNGGIRTRREVKGQNGQNRERTGKRNRVEQIKRMDLGHNRERSPSMPVMDGSRRKHLKKNREYAEKVIGPLNSKPHRKLTRKIPDSENQALCAQPVITVPKTSEVQEITQNTTVNFQKAEVQPHIVEPDFESFRYCENPKETFRAILERAARNNRWLKPVVPVQKESDDILEKVNIEEILRAWALKKIKFILQLIDANHTYSLIFLLITVVYLVYILWWDVSESVNEQSRFAAKVDNSGLPMKCFYYLMSLFRASTF
ncbi:uncharacterized protein [Drosophila takahashii]|uniref:uncharacterized protein n=1 Tax=Drosophila takahashii TaxID=29030 RepID=UPI003898EC06